VASTGRGENGFERALQCILLIYSLLVMLHATKFIAIQVSLGGEMENLFSGCRQMHPPIAGATNEYPSSAILTSYSWLSHIICGNQPPTLDTVFI